jgi:hypothetical protein
MASRVTGVALGSSALFGMTALSFFDVSEATFVNGESCANPALSKQVGMATTLESISERMIDL